MKIEQWIIFFTSSLGCIFNLLVIPIILRHSTERIGRYKYFLLVYSASSALFSGCLALTVPVWGSPPKGKTFYATLNLFHRDIQAYIVLFSVSAYTLCCIVIVWCFLYRLAVIKNKKPWLLRPRNFLIGLLVSAAVELLLTFFCWRILPTPERDEMLGDHFWNMTRKPANEVGYMGGILFQDAKKIDHEMVFAMGGYIVFFAIYITVISYCSYSIRRDLRQFCSVVDFHVNIHYRIYLLLTVQVLFSLNVLIKTQTILPMICHALPPVLVDLAVIFDFSISDYVLYLGMLLPIAQALDPIVMIILISEYKQAVFRFFNKVSPGITQTTSTAGLT